MSAKNTDISKEDKKLLHVMLKLLGIFVLGVIFIAALVLGVGLALGGFGISIGIPFVGSALVTAGGWLATAVPALGAFGVALPIALAVIGGIAAFAGLGIYKLMKSLSSKKLKEIDDKKESKEKEIDEIDEQKEKKEKEEEKKDVSEIKTEKKISDDQKKLNEVNKLEDQGKNENNETRNNIKNEGNNKKPEIEEDDKNKEEKKEKDIEKIENEESNINEEKKEDEKEKEKDKDKDKDIDKIKMEESIINEEKEYKATAEKFVNDLFDAVLSDIDRKNKNNKINNNSDEKNEIKIENEESNINKEKEIKKMEKNNINKNDKNENKQAKENESKKIKKEETGHIDLKKTPKKGDKNKKEQYKIITYSKYSDAKKSNEKYIGITSLSEKPNKVPWYKNIFSGIQGYITSSFRQSGTDDNLRNPYLTNEQGPSTNEQDLFIKKRLDEIYQETPNSEKNPSTTQSTKKIE